MSFDGIDPVLLEALAGATDRAAVELAALAASVAAGAASVGQACSAPGTIRAVAAALEEASADQRRRRREIMSDGELVAAASGVGPALAGIPIGPIVDGARDLWNGDGDRTMPFGKWVMTASSVAGKVSWLLSGADEARGLLETRAGQALVRLAPWLDSPAVSMAAEWAGVAGGLYQGVSGTVGLINDGNPVDAYQREGAHYVAKAAGTALGYSTAAFAVAPNPVTAGAIAVTGTVWLGAELWEHSDQIASGVSTAANAVGSAWEASSDVVDSVTTAAAHTVQHAASSAVDHAKAAASDAWDAATGWL